MVEETKNQENKCSHLEILDEDPINKFEDMLQKQKELQNALGNNMDNLSDKEKVAKFKEWYICIMAEFVETLDKLPWKEWKNYKTYELSKEESLELEFELIDIFHFYMNILLVFKVDPKRFYNLYNAKWKENHDRIKRGYSKSK